MQEARARPARHQAILADFDLAIGSWKRENSQASAPACQVAQLSAPLIDQD
jgi:hypothetical protein